MAEEKRRPAGRLDRRPGDQQIQVVEVLFESPDVAGLAGRPPVTAEVQGMDGVALGVEGLGPTGVAAAMLGESMHHDQRGGGPNTGGTGAARLPALAVQRQAIAAGKGFGDVRHAGRLP